MLARRQFLQGALGAAAMAAFPANRKPYRIDIHVHLGRNRQEMGQMSKDKLADAVQYLTGEMDRHDVSKALIVAVEPQFPTELYMEAAKLSSERLLAACSVIPRPADAAIEKLKAWRERGAKALKLQPAQYDPRDPAVEQVVAEAVRMGLPVLFHHTDTPKSFPDMLSHFSSTFPTGNFVVIHFGGVYGFWDVLPLARLPNVYLETSTAFARIVRSPLRSMLHFLVEEQRLNKLIFGSELPGEYGAVTGAIEELLGSEAGPDVRKAVYRGNAERILKLTVSGRRAQEEEERDRWQKTGEIFSALGVREGSRIAELGSGRGYFIVRLARAVGQTGRVWGVDIAEGEVKQLRLRLEEDEIENVEVVHGDTKDPKLAPASIDGILITDAYHEMTEYQAMLAAARQALKPGGKLVLVDRVRKEAKRQDLSKEERDRQANQHQIAPELVEGELREAGFQIIERRDPFVDRPGDSVHWLIVAGR